MRKQFLPLAKNIDANWLSRTNRFTKVGVNKKTPGIFEMDVQFERGNKKKNTRSASSLRILLRFFFYCQRSRFWDIAKNLCKVFVFES